jgi:hypothetical protein
MFHVYAIKFDVTGIFEKFLDFHNTKQGLRRWRLGACGWGGWGDRAIKLRADQPE